MMSLEIEHTSMLTCLTGKKKEKFLENKRTSLVVSDKCFGFLRVCFNLLVRTVLLFIMDTYIFRSVPDKLKCDLRVFGFEMYSYMMERRHFDSACPQPVGLTKGSQFTEEVGKAFMVVWRSNLKDIRKMINYDFPKFVVRLEYFVRFVMLRALEIVRHSTGGMVNGIAQVSVFLIELYSYCIINKYNYFLPYFPELWGAVLLVCYPEKFTGDSFEWSGIHSWGKKKSRVYDQSSPEKRDRDDPNFVLLSATYFNADPRKNYQTGDFWKKRVSKFHVLDGNDGIVEVVSPYGSVALEDRIALINRDRLIGGDCTLVEIMEENRGNYGFPRMTITDEEDSDSETDFERREN